MESLLVEIAYCRPATLLSKVFAVDYRFLISKAVPKTTVVCKSLKDFLKELIDNFS